MPHDPGKRTKSLHRFNYPGHAHELTFTCNRGLSFLEDPSACDILLTVLSEARKQCPFKLWAYVLMPNHVHLLLWPECLHYDISRIEGSIKGICSKRYRDYLAQNLKSVPQTFMRRIGSRSVFCLWQPGGGYDRNLWKAKAIQHSIAYIEANPVRKGLAATPQSYQWSSAHARATGKGVVPDAFDIPVALLNPRRQSIGKV